jgi:hypothetical protein
MVTCNNQYVPYFTKTPDEIINRRQRAHRLAESHLEEKTAVRVVDDVLHGGTLIVVQIGFSPHHFFFLIFS